MSTGTDVTTQESISGWHVPTCTCVHLLIHVHVYMVGIIGGSITPALSFALS